MDGLTFPMTIAQIPPFEAQNSDYSVNVFLPSNKDKTFIPHYASKYRNRKYISNLLLLDDGDRRHYTLIRDLSRLVAGRNFHDGRSFPCPYSLHCLTAAYLLETHMPDCGTHGLQAVRYPTLGKNILKFTNIQNQFEVGFCIFADFESFLIKSDEIDPTKLTNFLDTHEPSGFGCLTVSSIAIVQKK